MGVSWLWSDIPSSADGLAPDPPTWAIAAHRQFVERLTSTNPYPCHFGVQAQRLGHNSFTAIGRELVQLTAETLARILRTYLERSRSGPKRQSLIVFVEPPRDDVSLEDDGATFWNLLSALSAFDPSPWPDGYPRVIRLSAR